MRAGLARLPRAWAITERINEMTDIADHFPPDEIIDEWLLDYGGMLVRRAGPIASGLGLIDAYERCRVTPSLPRQMAYCSRSSAPNA